MIFKRNQKKGLPTTRTVYEINVAIGMVAVLTENGDFSVFEILGGDMVEIGDGVRWKDDTSLGSTVLTNISQGDVCEVYFQNHCSQKAS